MKIKDIKRDKSNYKTIKSESDIDEIIELPLRKPMKELYRKNIITIMSSANEINAKWLDEDGNNMYESKKDFDAVKFSYGDGFAYIILDNTKENYEKFDSMLKDIDEEYRTTLINFGKYKIVMFAMAKLMEMETTEQNKVALYLFNHIKI